MAENHDVAGPPRSRLAALVGLLTGVVLVTLDISLTSTAIRGIAAGMGITPARTIWIVNVYYLAVVAALLPLGALGEILGHRRIFLAGLCAFLIGAAISGAASSLGVLMAGRGVLAVGSAAVSATTPALIRTVYPSERLSRGLGLYAMIVGVALSVGPPAASAVLAVADWHWLYWQTLPIGVVAVLLAAKFLPDTHRSPREFDALSATLCAAGFAALLFAIAGAAHHGGASVPAALVVAVLCAVLLIVRERGQAAPILGVDLFRIPVFALSSLTSILSFSVQGLMFVTLPLLFQLRLGYSQVDAGLLILPWPITLAAMTVVASRLAVRVHPGILGGVGLAVLALGLVTLVSMGEGANSFAIGWRLVLCGVGFGLFQTPNMVAIMSSAPPVRSGSAGGILAMSRLLGQSIGAAIVALCLSCWPDAGLGIAMVAAVGLAGLGSAVSFARMLPGVRRAR